MKYLILIYLLSATLPTLAAPAEANSTCQNETVEITKLLGPVGTKTQLNGDNYKNALLALKSSFQYPTEAEIAEYRAELKERSADFSNHFNKVLATSCLTLRVDLIKSLLQLADSHKNSSPSIRADVWNGLREYFQILKYPTMLEDSFHAHYFEEAVKILKPQYKKISAEIKMLRKGIKEAAKKYEKDFGEVDFESTNFTQKHFEGLDFDLAKSNNFREEFARILSLSN